MNNLNPKPVEVKRDEMGYWLHPVLAKDEYLDKTISQIPELEGMEFSYQSYDEEKWLRATGQCDVSDWELKPPKGADWFLGGIFENEDGVIAMFMRPKRLSTL